MKKKFIKVKHKEHLQGILFRLEQLGYTTTLKNRAPDSRITYVFINGLPGEDNAITYSTLVGHLVDLRESEKEITLDDLYEMKKEDEIEFHDRKHHTGIMINGHEALCVLNQSYKDGVGYEGRYIAERYASLYLSGRTMFTNKKNTEFDISKMPHWIDEQGNQVCGYLYWIDPQK